jgi:hypothetical protein
MEVKKKFRKDRIENDDAGRKYSGEKNFSLERARHAQLNTIIKIKKRLARPRAMALR